MLPLVSRELRVGSRRWTTYWLRVLAAGTVVLFVCWWLINASHLVRQPGREVFLVMHRIVLAAIWIVVPILASDCLSRERREGTLGLLFLSNLSAYKIVLAKAAALGLTALTLWLAVVPITSVPLLLGGLPITDVLHSASLALGSLCLALAAGVLASVLCRKASAAALLAVVFAAIGHLHFCQVAGDLRGLFTGSTAVAFVVEVLNVWNLYSSTFGPWGTARTAAAPIGPSLITTPLVCLMVSLLVLMLAALILRGIWKDKPRTRQQLKVEQFFCAPSFFTGFFRSWMRRSLERNPIGWLETRSWTGRIMALIWLSVMISFSSLLAYTAVSLEDFSLFNGLMLLVLVTLAYIAASSFRRERETGALELILVSPLSERQIISGRLRALWAQFLPTFVLWLAATSYLSTAMKSWPVNEVVSVTSLFIVCPIVALYFSLRLHNVILAWFVTLLLVYLAPLLIAWGVQAGFWRFLQYFYIDQQAPWLLRTTNAISVPVQFAMAAWLLRRLHVNLVRRTFSFR